MSLIKEIKILRQMNHRGVVKIYDVYEDDHCIYLIKEILRGGELTAKLKQLKRFTEGQAVDFMHNLLLALDSIH